MRDHEEVRLLASKIEHPEGEKTVVVCRLHELRPHARDVRHGCGGRNDVVFEHALECVERHGQHPQTRGVDQGDRPGEQLGLRVRSVFVRTFLSEYAIDLKILQRGRLPTGREAQVGKGEVLLSRLLRVDGLIDEIWRNRYVRKVLVLRLTVVEDLESHGGAAAYFDDPPD